MSLLVLSLFKFDIKRLFVHLKCVWNKYQIHILGGKRVFFLFLKQDKRYGKVSDTQMWVAGEKYEWLVDFRI